MQKEEELWILKMMLLHIHILNIKISITKKMSLCKTLFLHTHYSLKINVDLGLAPNSFNIYVIFFGITDSSVLKFIEIFYDILTL